MALAAASRYAKALVDLATAPGAAVSPRQVSDQLCAFEAALASSVELRRILLSPAVPPVRKRAVVGRLGQALGLAALVRNFLYVVIDHRRVARIGEIRAAFDTLLDERLGLVRADVASAVPLTETEQQAVAAQLTRLSGRRVRAEFAVDAALIGGVKAQVGSTVYDGSVRGQLETLRRKLAAG
jgi:F-type H+-transporting ATPase subunit delta